ncbi:hypothetical protein BCON_0461g00050 [Botryotinia convoluta]|uniref:Uncharacterized protein n=1 Tax=Botryotinia convoluta TaxID=54673 RepID=A0A4Z1H6K3_9HELO|nr:hypothetical protein BCON_0461g00050 [Botryotinia convoluta]
MIKNNYKYTDADIDNNTAIAIANKNITYTLVEEEDHFTVDPKKFDEHLKYEYKQYKDVNDDLLILIPRKTCQA